MPTPFGGDGFEPSGHALQVLDFYLLGIAVDNGHLNSFQPPLPPLNVECPRSVFEAAAALIGVVVFVSIMDILMETKETLPVEFSHKVEPTLRFELRLPLIIALCYGVLPLKPRTFVSLSSLLRSLQLHLTGLSPIWFFEPNAMICNCPFTFYRPYLHYMIHDYTMLALKLVDVWDLNPSFRSRLSSHQAACYSEAMPSPKVGSLYTIRPQK